LIENRDGKKRKRRKHGISGQNSLTHTKLSAVGGGAEKSRQKSFDTGGGVWGRHRKQGDETEKVAYFKKSRRRGLGKKLSEGGRLNWGGKGEKAHHHVVARSGEKLSRVDQWDKEGKKERGKEKLGPSTY